MLLSPPRPGYDAFAALALNLWRTLDSERWEATRNPWLVLQPVSREKNLPFGLPHQ